MANATTMRATELALNAMISPYPSDAVRAIRWLGEREVVGTGGSPPPPPRGGPGVAICLSDSVSELSRERRFVGLAISNGDGAGR
jgi:hypothetical protein